MADQIGFSWDMSKEKGELFSPVDVCWRIPEQLKLIYEEFFAGNKWIYTWQRKRTSSVIWGWSSPDRSSSLQIDMRAANFTDELFLPSWKLLFIHCEMPNTLRSIRYLYSFFFWQYLKREKNLKAHIDTSRMMGTRGLSCISDSRPFFHFKLLQWSPNVWKIILIGQWSKKKKKCLTSRASDRMDSTEWVKHAEKKEEAVMELVLRTGAFLRFTTFDCILNWFIEKITMSVHCTVTKKTIFSVPTQLCEEWRSCCGRSRDSSLFRCELTTRLRSPNHLRIMR